MSNVTHNGFYQKTINICKDVSQSISDETHLMFKKINYPKRVY